MVTPFAVHLHFVAFAVGGGEPCALCAHAAFPNTHAVPTHMHLIAPRAVVHAHALAPRHVHVVAAIEHMNAARAYFHLGRSRDGIGRDIGRSGAGHGGRAASASRGSARRSTARRATCTTHARSPNAHAARAASANRPAAMAGAPRPARSAARHAASNGHVVFYVVVHVQKVVERHAVKLRERNEVVGVRRRLRALPFRHRLPRQPPAAPPAPPAKAPPACGAPPNVVRSPRSCFASLSRSVHHSAPPKIRVARSRTRPILVGIFRNLWLPPPATPHLQHAFELGICRRRRTPRQSSTETPKSFDILDTTHCLIIINHL